MPTKHRTLRLSDEIWQTIAAKFQEVVSFEHKPLRANPESDWQITEGLRMIADDEITLTLKKKRRTS